MYLVLALLSLLVYLLRRYKLASVRLFGIDAFPVEMPINCEELCFPLTYVDVYHRQIA
jgi:hypothetical protein